MAASPSPRRDESGDWTKSPVLPPRTGSAGVIYPAQTSLRVAASTRAQSMIWLTGV
jgi:hypothetical protein